MADGNLVPEAEFVQTRPSNLTRDCRPPAADYAPRDDFEKAPASAAGCGQLRFTVLHPKEVTVIVTHPADALAAIATVENGHHLPDDAAGFFHGLNTPDQ